MDRFRPSHLSAARNQITYRTLKERDMQRARPFSLKFSSLASMMRARYFCRRIFCHTQDQAGAQKICGRPYAARSVTMTDAGQTESAFASCAGRMWRINADPKQYCRDALKHFLIAGNTRVGSTWLETSLDLLSDVRCRREIKWKMSYQAPIEMHTYIRASTTSMKEQIALACRVGGCTETSLLAAMGSKLKFDPYGFVDEAAFAGLARIIEQDVIVILLRRSYVDIFKTWKAIGIRHLLNEESASRLAQSDPVLIAAARRHSEPIAARHIDLVHDGRRLASSRWPSLGREAFDYPLEEAIADLLVFFCNDIRALQATAHVAERYVVPYREIGNRLHQIADVLGSMASPEEVLAVLSDPVMQKIEAEDQVRVRPDGLLHGLSVVLDDAFESCLQGKLRPDDLVAHSLEANVTTFRIPGLGCASRLLTSVSGPGFNEPQADAPTAGR